MLPCRLSQPGLAITKEPPLERRPIASDVLPAKFEAMTKYLVAVIVGAFAVQLNAQADHHHTFMGSGDLIGLVRACQHRCKGTTPWKCPNSHAVSL